MPNTPHELSEALMVESAKFGSLTDELVLILEKKPALWMELRRDTKSDTSAERAWSATQDGMRETTLRLKLRAIEKSMSAAKTMLRIMSDEAHNMM